MLPRRGTAVRLCIVNKNTPGVLGELTTLIGKQGLNILQTVNTSRDDIAYNVVDLDGAPSNPSELADEIGSAFTSTPVALVCCPQRPHQIHVDAITTAMCFFYYGNHWEPNHNALVCVHTQE